MRGTHRYCKWRKHSGEFKEATKLNMNKEREVVQCKSAVAVRDGECLSCSLAAVCPSYPQDLWRERRSASERRVGGCARRLLGTPGLARPVLWAARRRRLSFARGRGSDVVRCGHWCASLVVVWLARGLARKRSECVYSPKSFFRPDLVVFRCAVRPLEGRSTWRASSYMW